MQLTFDSTNRQRKSTLAGQLVSEVQRFTQVTVADAQNIDSVAL